MADTAIRLQPTTKGLPVPGYCYENLKLPHFLEIIILVHMILRKSSTGNINSDTAKYTEYALSHGCRLDH